MIEKTAEIQQLLEKFLKDDLSAAELMRFRELAADPANTEMLLEMIGSSIKNGEQPETTTAAPEELFKQVLSQAAQLRPQTAPAHVIPLRKEGVSRRWRWWAAAAIILLLGIGAELLISVNKKREKAIVAINDHEIPPGKNGAILTLEDGSKVVLDSLGNEWGTTQHGASVTLKNGALTYTNTANSSETVLFNTVTIPRGRQFQLRLPDGTHVWLNSGSSIRYPTAFSGKERMVEMKGEAYYEVAQNSQQPFKVNIAGHGQVEVLGTSFNVNAYDDEPFVRTTLLTGAVLVEAAGKKQQLLPAQQAKLSVSGELSVAEQVDLAQVMAWKNGMFNFNGSDIKSVLRQISRWYDIDVIYTTEPDNAPVTGEMQRNLSLSVVMDILKDLGIKYTLEGRTMIISK